MKILLGIVIGAAIFSGASVFAQSTGIVHVQSVDAGYVTSTMSKWYDNDNGVVCYTYVNRYDSAAISCLHN